MPERVASDHTSVVTLRATLTRRGATTHSRLSLPAKATDHIPAKTVVRLVIDGATRHAQIREGVGGNLVIDGVADTPRLARSPGGGSDRLAEWVDAADVEFGRSILFDVVVPSFLYGLRLPGEHVVYDAVEPPDPGLASITEELDGT